MEKVEVRVRFVAEWGGSSMRMVVMETVDRKTVFPVIIADSEAHSLTREWMEEELKRPDPYDLLAEMMKGFALRMQEALIYRLSEGVFYTRMVLVSEQQVLELESRVSDAVIMAIRGHCPVYVVPEVLEKVGLPSRMLKQVGDLLTNEAEKPEPASEMSVETLEQRLQEAVENEDFESASLLRDQIRALKGNS
ncbi:MAG: bifunctional nuclease family protein [Bacteroidales bacterium]|nr:bifunctional nuclease family protein [Bacteroidales bacterium]